MHRCSLKRVYTAVSSISALRARVSRCESGRMRILLSALVSIEVIKCFIICVIVNGQSRLNVVMAVSNNSYSNGTEKNEC